MEETGSEKTHQKAREEMNLREEADETGFAVLPEVLSAEEVGWIESKVEAARHVENTARVTNSSGT